MNLNKPFIDTHESRKYPATVIPTEHHAGILRSFNIWAITGLTCFCVWTCFSQANNLKPQSQPKDDPLGIETQQQISPSGTNAAAKIWIKTGQTNEDGFDIVETLEQTKSKAEKGEAFSQSRLGYIFFIGEGVTKDYVEAAKWWRKAAEQNDAGAQFNLGICYHGQGVAKDYVEAYKWWLLAAGQGYDPAKKNMAGLENLLTQEQIAEGQKRARNFNDSLPTWENTKPVLNADDWEIVGGSSTGGGEKSMTLPVLVSVLLTALAVFAVLVWWLMKQIDVKKFLLLALAAPSVFVWRFMKRIGAQKFIMICGTLAFVLCGLFPPWLYISSQGHTRSASSSFILSPPPTVGGAYGTKLDISRLAVEWLCIAVATGTVLLLVSKSEKKKDLKG